MISVMSQIDRTKQKVRYFLAKNLEVKGFLEQILILGDVAIFGGMLRHLSMEGNRSFTSDIDLVVDTDNLKKLNEKLMHFNARRNSFGGYRFVLKKRPIDIWPLKETWAFQKGYVHGASFSNLTKTTFFNWDAVAYSLRTGKVYCAQDYFQQLSQNMLDINLEPNPNPIGAAVRTYRTIAAHKSLSLSERLADYVSNVTIDAGAAKLCEAERKGYSRPVLSENFVEETVAQIRETVLRGWKGRLYQISPQQELFQGHSLEIDGRLGNTNELKGQLHLFGKSERAG